MNRLAHHLLRTAVAVVVATLCLMPAAARAAPDIAMQMSVDVSVPAPGQTVQFTITATNIGSDPASSVEVTDRLPAGLAIPAGLAAFPSTGTYDTASGVWTIGGLAAGGSATLVMPAVVIAFPQPACLVNAAAYTGPAVGSQQDDLAVAAVKRDAADRCVDLRIQSVSISATGCKGGYTLDYWVNVKNVGPDDATNVYVDLLQSPIVAPNLHFVETFCTGLRCTIPTLQAGQAIMAEAKSASFNNKQDQLVAFTTTASSAETEYVPDDNQRLDHVTIPRTPDCYVLDGVGSHFAIIGSCFIATAAYGSPLEPHVMALRHFRDEYLQRSAAGRAFIRLYYRYSPPIAAVIARHESLRFIVRVLLTPLVLAIAFPGKALAMVLLIVGTFGWRRLRRRQDGQTPGPG